MEKIDYNTKKDLINELTIHYKSESQGMWNFRSNIGATVLDFCLEYYNNENAVKDITDYFSADTIKKLETKGYKIDNKYIPEEAYEVALVKYQSDLAEKYSINKEIFEAIQVNSTESNSLKVLFTDLKTKFSDLVERIFVPKANFVTSNDLSSIENTKVLLKSDRNLNDEEFSTVFDYILIEHYHKQDYAGSREIVFSMSEEDRERFNKKFTAGHSPELLKKHFTDFENVNQAEFKESVFKVTGKVENIPVPPFLYENMIYQFTNHTFKDKISGETLYLLKDINNNEFFLEHLFHQDPERPYRAVRSVKLLESKEFDTSEFARKYAIQVINDMRDVTEVLKDLYNPQFDNNKVKELLNSQTVNEKRETGDTTLKIVLQSHLSDAIIELQNHNPDLVESRLEFCKKLINKYGDLDMGIKDVDLNNLWTKVWESKQRIESSLFTENENTAKPGILTVDKAEENFREGDWPINEMLDEKGELILRLQEVGYSKDNYVIEFPQTNLNVGYKDLESAIGRFNEIVENYGLENNKITYNMPVQKNDLKANSNEINIEKQIEFFLADINPKGEVSNFPKEVLHQMLYNQYKQLGFYDLESLEFDKTSGFQWEKTIQGKDFWENVVIENNFNIFFDRYPEEKYSNDHLNNGISR